MEARFYTGKEGGTVKCGLCPHGCMIPAGECGFCGVRFNRGGRLMAESYGAVSAEGVDPVEKKPLYHYYPGRQIYSVGSFGCNLRCPYCQNWQISQSFKEDSLHYSPENVIANALSTGSFGIAYTYSEPLVWYEFVAETASSAAQQGLKNVLVTNGFINSEPFDDLLNNIHALNIDLKTFNSDTYSKIHRGSLNAVKSSIRTAYEKGCHVEITTLVVTGINDNRGELMETARFISSLDRSIPWHISRYYPAFKYDAPATDESFILSICEEASSVLDYVYAGNIASPGRFSDTFCPACGSVLIKRSGYRTVLSSLDARSSSCLNCGMILKFEGLC